MNSRNSKAALRRTIRSALKHLPPERRGAASEMLRARLKEQSFFQSAGSILFFAPLSKEIDLWPLLAEALATGKIIALPRFDSEHQRYVAARVRDAQGEIVIGQFGIREPAAHCAEIPPADLDLVLVPGVAFDGRGHRLGRGHGFYDRLLVDCPAQKIGIAFDEQLVDEVPAEKQDVKMDWILTPTRCVQCDG